MPTLLFIEQYFYPEGWGGAEIPRDIVSGLRQAGFDVEVLCGKDQYTPMRPGEVPDPSACGVRIFRVPRIAGGPIHRFKSLRILWFCAYAFPWLLMHRGVDLFDCILPTKMAQQGWAYTFQGVLEAMRPAMKLAQGPIEPGCTCLACHSQPLGYIHHLLRVGNAQGVRWLAIHNVHHTQALMSRLRSAILSDSWQPLYHELTEQLPRRLKEPLLE